MPLNLRPVVRTLIASVLVAFFLIPTDLMAQQTHVVTPADLQKEISAASQVRQQNLKTLQQFLSTPTAEKAMKSAKIDARQVRQGISALDDQDLARLAARADKAQTDFAAGALGERDLIWIILAIAVIVLIIVAVR